MHRILVVAFLILLCFSLPGTPVQAASGEPPRGFDPGVVCLPDPFTDSTRDCTSAGPVEYLDSLARLGLTLPIPPLPASKPDPNLTYVPYHYGEVRTARAPVYASVEDALTGNKKNAVRRIDSSFTYISYTEEALVDGKRFYLIEPGAWMTANDVSRLGIVPLFQGLTFSRTPLNAFGWVLSSLSPGPVETKRTPGYTADDYTGHILQHHEVIQVFSEQQVEDAAWYMVGPNEWVPRNVIARVIPNTTPPSGVSGDRWIEINLFEQTLAVYSDNQLVFATLIASGLDPFWTRPGLFQIYNKLETTPMRGAFEADQSDAYYLEDVPFTMYFDKARALHGAYWRANFGYPQSHGCVNLSVGDAHWLFDWAEIGDWVYVWDPSGETPEDPERYGAGGA